MVIECNEVGIISRQETVSMIPCLFLSQFIKSDFVVIDFCAAPGNKTAQILELLDYDLSGKYLDGEHRGFVIANDADEKRAHVMVHQIKRIGSAKYLVTNKLAQCLPAILPRLRIDAILCDVPCSSDGTLRKSPDLWKKWSCSYGNGLHSVQLSILTHALHLLSDDGICLYSTCSFNPIENEAVICSALLSLNKHYSDTDNIRFELIDCSKMFPALQRNKGLTQWSVWNKSMTKFYSKYSDVPSKEKNKIKPTMFEPIHREKCQKIKDDVLNCLQLDRCMRFLPNFHDSGGFFVAVLRKNKNKKQEKEEKFDDAQMENIENREFKRRHVQIHNDNTPYFKFSEYKNYEIELSKLCAFYGLNIDQNIQSDIPYFDVNELLVRGLTNPRSIWFVPASIGNVISNRLNDRLRIVQSGCRAFVRHDTKVTEHACKWRLTQDGTTYIAKYCSKQIVELPLTLFLIYCFCTKLNFEECAALEDGKYKTFIDEMLKTQKGGPCIMALNDKDESLQHMEYWKALSGKSNKRMDLMIKKQSILLLLQNHLCDIYKAECMQINAKKYQNIHIDLESNGRAKYNQIKNKKNKKKHKFKRNKNRNWTFRKLKNEGIIKQNDNNNNAEK